jgi:hypothetical protein
MTLSLNGRNVVQRTDKDLRTSMLARMANVIIAIVLSLLPLPAMRLLDHLNRGCGDGLCGFFTGILVLVALGAATLFFIYRSARRKEAPAVLRLVPIALWVLAFVPLLV